MRTSKFTIAVPTAKPPNPLILAVTKRLAHLGGGQHAIPQNRDEHLARMDLDQRVRELGEW